MDRSANQQGCKVKLVLITLDNIKVKCALHFGFQTSNNETEYEVLLIGIKIVMELRMRK